MADDLDKYKIKQLSIFSENRPGRLMDFSKAMGEEAIAGAAARCQSGR